MYIPFLYLKSNHKNNDNTNIKSAINVNIIIEMLD